MILNFTEKKNGFWKNAKAQKFLFGQYFFICQGCLNNIKGAIADVKRKSIETMKVEVSEGDMTHPYNS